MHISKLVEFIRQDELQQENLQALADHRKGDIEMYIQKGIIYIPHLDESDEWQYICEQLGVSKEEIGVNDLNKFMMSDGFILPITDIQGDILFYLNHDFTRDANMKYINVKTDLAPNTENVKMYGLHNTPFALEKDCIFVAEGYFDALRLEYSRLPSAAPLGTKLMPYHIQYFHRFRRVVYIEDNDKSGEIAFTRFKQLIPHAISVKLYPGYKDIDELAGNNPIKYEHFVQELKTYL